MGSIDDLAKKWDWDFKSECKSLLRQEWKTALFDLVKQMTDSTPSNRQNLGNVKFIVNDLIENLGRDQNFVPRLSALFGTQQWKKQKKRRHKNCIEI